MVLLQASPEHSIHLRQCIHTDEVLRRVVLDVRKYMLVNCVYIGQS